MIADVTEQVAQFTTEDILHLLERVGPIFRSEPRLINLPNTPLVFIGDTHGDWKATQTILKHCWETPSVLVFLGDYVDRGPYQIENINLLFQLKITAPERIIILRGNHETPQVNRNYGFYDAVQNQREDLIQHYWKIFADLPLAAVNQKQKVFAVHGGIPENLVKIEDINALPREI
ncbi:MAG: metallophosphoesterase, partial [Candidatus Thorarchaeota archaeon]